MSHSSDLIKENILNYLKSQEEKSLLRFITCGSVDDGKSTLIGRLLHDTKLIYEDTIAAIKRDSKKYNTTNNEFDLSLLVDGLQSEREQGITIDVAYRYFSTEKRKFIIADTPGHEQYTRNMVTGASTANLAIILIDALKGVQVQTRRHSYICSLLGIKHFVIAINKMDAVNYQESVFLSIQKDYFNFLENMNGRNIIETHFIPMSALVGDNIVHQSSNMSWYRGHTLMNLLDSIYIDSVTNKMRLRFPVQYVNRPNSNFRGYCGTVSSGVLSVGEKVRVIPSDKRATVESIFLSSYNKDKAGPGESITITLDAEIDISRGDIIVGDDSNYIIGNLFDATIVWMSDYPLIENEGYLIKINSRLVSGRIAQILHQVDVNTLQSHSSNEIPLNGIGICRLELTSSILIDAYRELPETGSFIVIDKISNATLGAGMIIGKVDYQQYEVRQNQSLSEVVWNNSSITPYLRADLKKQIPKCIWLTGLSGSGKSTLANALEQALYKQGFHTMLLDGDNIRHGLCNDLTMSEVDRSENIRRVAEVAKLMTEAGLIVISAFISPIRKDREFARSIFSEGDFVEVYLDIPLEVCEQRDPKGLYKKARSGELKNFTGVDSVFEPPLSPEMVIGLDSIDSIPDVIDKLTNIILK